MIVFDLKDGQTTVSQPDPAQLQDWLEEFSVGDLWSRNVIGGRPWASTGKAPERHSQFF